MLTFITQCTLLQQIPRLIKLAVEYECNESLSWFKEQGFTIPTKKEPVIELIDVRIAFENLYHFV